MHVQGATRNVIQVVHEMSYRVVHEMSYRVAHEMSYH